MAIKFSKKFIEKIMSLDTSKGISEIFDKRLHRSVLVSYSYLSNGYQDIKKVFKQTQAEDKELINFYKKYINEDDDWDVIAIKIAKAVNKRLTYKSDSETWGRVEYWASPIDTHRKAYDDCDGFAVLTVYLWGLFGIPAYRRFVRAGNVVGGGHATALYLSLADNEFYPIEGSYYASESWKNFNKIPLYKNKKYLDTWWITNEEKSYSGNWFFKFIKGL